MEKDVIDHAMETGDLALAEEAFREIDTRLGSLADAKERADLLLRKAVLYGVLGNFGEARMQLDVALHEAPDDPDIRLQFDYIDATIYHQEKNIGEAFARLSTVLSKYANQLARPDLRAMYEDIQLRRAFELFGMQRFQDAVPLFEEALLFHMKPGEKSAALASLGISYSELKNREAAKEYLLQASERRLDDHWLGQVHFHLGLTYAHLKHLQESKREFQLCERYLPISVVYAWLSRICSLLGEKSEAERYARLARPV